MIKEKRASALFLLKNITSRTDGGLYGDKYGFCGKSDDALHCEMFAKIT